MKTFRFKVPQNTYEQIQILQKKWSNDEIGYPYEISDVIRVCVATVWETEINNSLKESLTNNS